MTNATQSVPVNQPARPDLQDSNALQNSPALQDSPAQTCEILQDREDLRDYVAQLQLHMTLQAKNLVTTGEISFSPSGLHLSGQTQADRFPLLQATQAMAEKLASRQR